MKKSLTRSLILASMSVMALGLTACPNDGGNKTKITFWHTMGQELQGVLDRIITQFVAENPDIEIEHSAQGGYTDLEEKLTAAIPAGTTPTMAYCYPDHVAEYMKANAVLDLTAYVNGEETGFDAEKDGALDDIIDIYWQEGKEYATPGIFSVPYAKSTELMFYSKDIFEDKEHHASGQNYTVPTTWEEMEALMAEMKADYPDIIPLGYDSDANLFITMCEQYGIPYTHIDKTTGKGSADFNNAAAKAMVTKLVSWYNAGYISTQGLSNGAYTSTQFTEGTLAMTIGSSGGTGYNFTANIQKGIGTAQVPHPATDSAERFAFGGDTTKVNDHIIMQGPSICFFKKGKQAEKDAAWKFYKFMIKTMNTAQFSVTSGYSPVRTSSFTCDAMVSYLTTPQVDKAALIQTTVGMYKDLTSRYFVSPAFHGSSAARNQVDGIFSTVAMGVKTLDAAFADAYVKATFAMK